MRREVPMAITFIVGLIIIMNNFVKIKLGGFELAVFAKDITGWATIILAFATFLASVNLFRSHGQKISRQKAGWVNSLVLLASLLLVAGLGIYGQLTTGKPVALFSKIFDFVITPLGNAMFAILAFYIASAAYRAFRVRSAEATVLLVSAVILMLGRAPIGELIWNKFPVIADWLMTVPNNAGQRGIMIGASIGAIATSVRILLGMERGHLGGE